jgi:Flp pilus assembly protein TadG
MQRKARRDKQKGSILVEFAVGSTVVVTLFAGVFQFGWSLLLYNNLMTSVTNAAITAAQRDYNISDPADFTDDIKNMVVYGDLDAGGVRVAPDITTSHVSVNVATNAGVPQYVTVSVNGYQVKTLFANFTLSNKPRVTVPFAGRVVCSGC